MNVDGILFLDYVIIRLSVS